MPTYKHLICSNDFRPQRSAYFPSFSSGEAIFDPPLFWRSTYWSGGGPGPHFKACRPKPAHKPSNRDQEGSVQSRFKNLLGRCRREKVSQGEANQEALARKMGVLIFKGSGKPQFKKSARPISPGKDKPRGGESTGLGPKGEDSFFRGL